MRRAPAETEAKPVLVLDYPVAAIVLASRTDHAHQAILEMKRPPSLQFLRGKAHALLNHHWPDRGYRYRWLKRNSPKMHMSEMTRPQLISLINKIESMYGKSV